MMPRSQHHGNYLLNLLCCIDMQQASTETIHFFRGSITPVPAPDCCFLLVLLCCHREFHQRRIITGAMPVKLVAFFQMKWLRAKCQGTILPPAVKCSPRHAS
ncbi:TPA: hypothetical protein ACH3X3_012842 [Trebouxia sp. C0006]